MLLCASVCAVCVCILCLCVLYMRERVDSTSGCTSMLWFDVDGFSSADCGEAWCEVSCEVWCEVCCHIHLTCTFLSRHRCIMLVSRCACLVPMHMLNVRKALDAHRRTSERLAACLLHSCCIVAAYLFTCEQQDSIAPNKLRV